MLFEYIDVEVFIMWNEEDERNNANQDDLSDMINAYSQDNELKKKINELKKQKAEAESTRKTEDTFAFSTLKADDTQPLPKTSGIPDIQADDDLTKTRVGFDGDSAYDKTLVIMDSKPKATFQSEEVEEEEYEEPDYEEEEEEMDNSSHTQVFSDLHDDYDEDEEEEEDDDLPRRKKSKSKKDKNPEADQKMNKIITYVIIGVVVVLLLVAGGFGVKYALGKFLSGDSDKKKDDTKVTETNKPTTDTPKTDDDKTNENDGKSDANITDNSAEKAKVSGELKALEDQLASKKNEVAAAQKALDEANTNKSNYLNQVSTLSQEAQAAKNNQAAAEKAYTDAQANYDANPTEENKAALDAAQKDMQEKQQAASSISTEFETENTKYAEKVKSLDKAISDAKDELDNLKKEQEALEIQVSDKTTELNKFN